MFMLVYVMNTDNQFWDADADSAEQKLLSWSVYTHTHMRRYVDVYVDGETTCIYLRI